MYLFHRYVAQSPNGRRQTPFYEWQWRLLLGAAASLLGCLPRAPALALARRYLHSMPPRTAPLSPPRASGGDGAIALDAEAEEEREQESRWASRGVQAALAQQPRAEDAAAESVLQLLRGSIARNTLYMARDEMRQVSDERSFDGDVLLGDASGGSSVADADSNGRVVHHPSGNHTSGTGPRRASGTDAAVAAGGPAAAGHASRVSVYWGARDAWAPLSYLARLQQRYPAVEWHRCSAGHPHAFVCDHAAVVDVARHTARQVRVAMRFWRQQQLKQGE